MFVLKGCKYNNKVAYVFRDGSPHMVDLLCVASSDIYYGEDGKGRFIDLNVSDFVDEVQELERYVETFYKKPLVFPAMTDILRRVKLPSRYGHVMIPIVDRDGSKITTFDVKNGTSLRIRLQAKSAWCSDTHCGIAWIVHSIKTT
jgi:hypothetical protein